VQDNKVRDAEEKIRQDPSPDSEISAMEATVSEQGEEDEKPTLEELFDHLDTLHRDGVRLVETTYVINKWALSGIVPMKHHGFYFKTSQGQYFTLDFGREGVEWDVFGDEKPDLPNNTIFTRTYPIDVDPMRVKMYCEETEPFVWLRNDCESWTRGLMPVLGLPMPRKEKPEACGGMSMDIDSIFSSCERPRPDARRKPGANNSLCCGGGADSVSTQQVSPLPLIETYQYGKHADPAGTESRSSTNSDAGGNSATSNSCTFNGFTYSGAQLGQPMSAMSSAGIPVGNHPCVGNLGWPDMQRKVSPLPGSQCFSNNLPLGQFAGPGFIQNGYHPAAYARDALRPQASPTPGIRNVTYNSYAGTQPAPTVSQFANIAPTVVYNAPTNVGLFASPNRDFAASSPIASSPVASSPVSPTKNPEDTGDVQVHNVEVPTKPKAGNRRQRKGTCI